MPSPVGFERTYVKLNGEFSADRWLKALRDGRSFATNGPILTFEVDNHGLGDAIRMESPSPTVSVHCTARSQSPLERIDIIHNGNVIASTIAENGETTLELEQKIPVGPGWLAARCFQIAQGTQVFAATSPVYLEHGDKPFFVEESVRYYRDYVQSIIDIAFEANQFSNPDERVLAYETLEQALAFYQNLLP
jgi:hypothetical protein